MADTETTTVHTAEVVRYDDPVIITERVAVAAFIAGYTDPTRRSYATDLRIFAGWCHDHGINLLNVKRPHLETFARWMEQEGRMASTIGRRLSTLSSFYKYCQTEDILDKNPALNVRRPKVHDESRTLGLDRNELGALLVQAGLGDLRDGALITLLALNGLRISEALNADIDDLSTERGHRTLAIVRKGGNLERRCATTGHGAASTATPPISCPPSSPELHDQPENHPPADERYRAVESLVALAVQRSSSRTP